MALLSLGWWAGGDEPVQAMSDTPRLGAKIRALRRKAGLTQTQLAHQLGISPSYLNLIEHDRRALSGALLLKLAQHFQLDLRALAGDDDAQLAGQLMEIFGDALFEAHELGSTEVRELAATQPTVARAIVHLYEAYREARSSADSLAETMTQHSPDTTPAGASMPSEEVSDFIQTHGNYFAELEDRAQALVHEARRGTGDLYGQLMRYIESRHRVVVRVATVSAMRGALRRFDPETRALDVSEVLSRGSRNFQVAHQLCLLEHGEVLDRLTHDPLLTTDTSRALARVALASYFAAAVLLPYDAFLAAARAERYDLELLGHRFRTSFEQVCHRLTTLRRPGAAGVPFHFMRVDMAGNISKRFSASGMRIARFSGACPRWNIHAAFLTPGVIRVQVSRLPEGAGYFDIARTIRKDGGGYHAHRAWQAVDIGCPLEFAKELVYSDGIDLTSPLTEVPVGVTCRLCSRMDCEQRAFPAIAHPLEVQPDVRGRSFYAPLPR